MLELLPQSASIALDASYLGLASVVPDAPLVSPTLTNNLQQTVLAHQLGLALSVLAASMGSLGVLVEWNAGVFIVIGLVEVLLSSWQLHFASLLSKPVVLAAALRLAIGVYNVVVPASVVLEPVLRVLSYLPMRLRRTFISPPNLTRIAYRYLANTVAKVFTLEWWLSERSDVVVKPTSAPLLSVRRLLPRLPRTGFTVRTTSNTRSNRSTSTNMSSKGGRRAYRRPRVRGVRRGPFGRHRVLSAVKRRLSVLEPGSLI